MRGFFLSGFFALIISVGTAAAQTDDLQILSGAAPWWVLRGQGIAATLDYNFAGAQYFQAGSAAGADPKNLITVTRASTGYAADLSGLYYSFANNIARVTNAGLMVEVAATNDALWSRDMSNAAWVKVGVGTALNAAGIDGTANSATTLTATGTAGVCTSSCTSLQTITLGSSADTYSVFLKRVTGVGAVNITINNLTGATACTLVPNAFTRCSVTATLANPVIGVQLTALNDVVVADFNQMEPGGFPTTPILTTTVAVTRAADQPIVKSLGTIGVGYTLYGSGVPESPTSNTNNQFLAMLDAGSANDRIAVVRAGTSNFGETFSAAGGSQSTQVAAVLWSQNVIGKLAVSVASGAQAGVFNGGTPGTTAGALPANPTNLHIGTQQSGATQFNGSVQRIALWPTVALPSAALKQMTLGTTP